MHSGRPGRPVFLADGLPGLLGSPGCKNTPVGATRRPPGQRLGQLVIAIRNLKIAHDWIGMGADLFDIREGGGDGYAHGYYTYLG